MIIHHTLVHILATTEMLLVMATTAAITMVVTMDVTMDTRWSQTLLAWGLPTHNNGRTGPSDPGMPPSGDPPGCGQPVCDGSLASSKVLTTKLRSRICNVCNHLSRQEAYNIQYAINIKAKISKLLGCLVNRGAKVYHQIQHEHHFTVRQVKFINTTLLELKTTPFDSSILFMLRALWKPILD